MIAATALAAAVTTADTTIGNTWLTPAFLAALATLITALTGLVVAFRAANSLSTAQATAEATHSKVETVVQQTNGALQTLQERNAALEKELAGIAHRSAIRGATGPSGPTAAPTA